MERALRWKTFILLGLVVLAVTYLVPSVTGEGFGPFDKRVKLGLDLQGGLHLVYRVNLDKVIDDKAGELRRDIEAQLVEQKIDARVETPQANPEAGVPLGAVIIVPGKAGGDVAAKLKTSLLEDHAETLTEMDCPESRK